MGNELFQQFPSLVEEANSILGYSLDELCAQGPEDKLGQTQYTQPALYLVSYLAGLAKQEGNQSPDMAAGHSVGEFAALAAAKAFSFADGLRMVTKRGEIMAKVSGGGMAAVIGLESKIILATLKDKNLQKIDLANFNSPGQIVISGPALEIDSSIPLLKEAGAKLVVPLKVSGAFHSEMMKEPSVEFAIFLEEFSFTAPSFPIFANVTGSKYSNPEEIASLLVKQMYSSVLWSESIQKMRSLGADEFIECGPGNVLTKLLRQIP
jgi:malonyl CoA-acyl carrier protein transacylase